MKIALSDLKKVVTWIENNSLTQHVDVQLQDRKMYFECRDKYDTGIEITLFEDSSMMAKIKKEDRL